MSTLDGFTSRWTIPFACACPSASQSAIPIPTMSRSDSAPLFEQAVERLALDQLRDEVRALVVRTGLVQGDDPGMGEPRRRARLALEAAAVDPIARDDLDRDLAIEPLVVRAPDGAEAAGAETSSEAIALEHERAGAAGDLALRAGRGRLDLGRTLMVLNVSGLRGPPGGIRLRVLAAHGRRLAGSHEALFHAPWHVPALRRRALLRPRALQDGLRACTSGRTDGHTGPFSSARSECCRSSTTSTTSRRQRSRARRRAPADPQGVVVGRPDEGDAPLVAGVRRATLSRSRSAAPSPPW